MADLVVMRKILIKTGITGDNVSPSPYVKEKEEETKKIIYSKDDTEMSSFNIVSFIISCFAVYLSWSCNTAKDVHIVPKLIYSFFAFVFGGIYLIYYFLVRSEWCAIKN